MYTCVWYTCVAGAEFVGVVKSDVCLEGKNKNKERGKGGKERGKRKRLKEEKVCDKGG